MNLAPLPREVAALLRELHAPPRLIAHLTLVHDVARTLTARLDAAWPALVYDRESVWMGAALHDIGKVAYPEELTQPGHAHEAAGEALLLDRGLPKALARFARTHAQWIDGSLEDLLVAAADTCWRGKRDERLDSALCHLIAQQTEIPQWQAFASLDDIVVGITALADQRLAWQAQFSAHAS